MATDFLKKSNYGMFGDTARYVINFDEFLLQDMNVLLCGFVILDPRKKAVKIWL